MSVNTQEYWDNRFRSEDWFRKGGHIQSYNHASKFIGALQVPTDFSGTICDFGCAEGDAFPLYRRQWPNATLKGVDFAEEAVRRAREKYGSIATFHPGSYEDIESSDIIICAHTVEHIENHRDVIQSLRNKSERLFIIVPYKENPIGKEHLRVYDENSYSDLSPRRYAILEAGWQYSGLFLLYKIHLTFFIAT